MGTPRFRTALVAYATIVAAANATILLGVAAARFLGRDTRVRDPRLPQVPNLRRVDDRLWVGGQPSPGDYRGLSAIGVQTVVDLRTGDPGDPREDDPSFLDQLGMEHVALPVPDGHAPDPTIVERFVRIVDRSPGLVFVHCGAGVGRSTSLQAAYLASAGRRLTVLEQLAIGTPSVEQAWFVLRTRAGRPAPRNHVVELLSRLVFDGPRTALHRLFPRRRTATTTARAALLRSEACL